MEFIYIPENYYKYKVILVKREVDCSTITEDEFVKYIIEDVKKATDEYASICDNVNRKRRKSHIEYAIKEVEHNLRKKYKRESTIQKYIDKAIHKAETEYIGIETIDHMFFDFNPDYNDMGINIDCIIRRNNSEEKLRRAYKVIKNSKYFKYGKGWQFTYRANTPKSTYSSRPEVELILDEYIRKQQHEDGEKLAEAVANFYKHSKYWGD